jgi:hypothetical protein
MYAKVFTGFDATCARSPGTRQAFHVPQTAHVERAVTAEKPIRPVLSGVAEHQAVVAPQPAPTGQSYVAKRFVLCHAKFRTTILPTAGTLLYRSKRIADRLTLTAAPFLALLLPHGLDCSFHTSEHRLFSAPHAF